MESTDPNHGRIGTHMGGFARKSHRDSHKKIALALNAESHYKTARMSDRSEGSRLKVTSVGTGTQQGFIPANLSSSNRWKRTDLKRTWIKLSTFDSGQEMANTALKTRLTSTLLVIALLVNSVAATGMADCSCRASHVNGCCCCSQSGNKSLSSCGCCRIYTKDDETSGPNCCGAKSKSVEQRTCCQAEHRGSQKSNCRQSGCTCGCQKSSPPATPVENNNRSDQVLSDCAVSAWGATASASPNSRGFDESSAGSKAASALHRCVSLCRFAL